MVQDATRMNENAVVVSRAVDGRLPPVFGQARECVATNPITDSADTLSLMGTVARCRVRGTWGTEDA